MTKKIAILAVLLFIAGTVSGQNDSSVTIFSGAWVYAESDAVMYIFKNNEVDVYLLRHISSKWAFTYSERFLTLTLVAKYDTINHSTIGSIDILEYWFYDNYLFLKNRDGQIYKFIKI
jgi:hypothetical protein